MCICVFHNDRLSFVSHIVFYVFLHVLVCVLVSLCPLWFVFLYFPFLTFQQVRTLASAGGPDNLVMLDPGKYKARPRVPEPAGDGSSTQPKWQVGEQEYEALMRMLDNLVRMKKRGLL